MARISKRRQKINEMVEAGKVYSFAEAIQLLKSVPGAAFKKLPESVDIAMMLGIDVKKSDQGIRGSTVLPHGTGKTVRVAVFTQGANVKAAEAAGADHIGMQDLAEQITKGSIDFDVVIASPDAMGVVGRLGPVLGPRGLMPNPKVGTVTPDVATAVKNAKGGQVRYRAEKNGIVHCSIGKITFDVNALKENCEALLTDLRKAKPSTSKGIYMKKCVVSTTMGPGILVDLASLTF